MIYKFGERLTEISQEEWEKEKCPAVFLTDSNHAEETLAIAGIVYEAEIQIAKIGFCKIENQQECMVGTFCIPKLLDVLGSRYRMYMFVNENNVVIVDDLSNSKIEVLDGIEKITGIRPAFEQVDLRDKAATEAVFQKYPDIEGIIHFAASKAVGESVQKPLLYYRNNIVSLINLLELMPKYQVKGIIFSSSCTVYGQPKPENLPVTEEAPHQKATSPYGNTKEINEQIIADYIHSGAAIKSIVLRYFNPIGAHPSAEIGELPNGVPNNLIPYVTQTAMGIRKELTIFGNDYDTPDGTCIRDYIYVVDLAKAHVAAMARVLDKETEPIEYFNIGTGNGNSTLEIVETFEKATGVKLNWKYGPRREGDIEKIWGDCTKANKVLGWKAEAKLEDVLASAWKWQQKLRADGIM